MYRDSKSWVIQLSWNLIVTLLVVSCSGGDDLSRVATESAAEEAAAAAAAAAGQTPTPTPNPNPSQSGSCGPIGTCIGEILKLGNPTIALMAVDSSTNTVIDIATAKIVFPFFKINLQFNASALTQLEAADVADLSGEIAVFDDAAGTGYPVSTDTTVLTLTVGTLSSLLNSSNHCATVSVQLDLANAPTCAISGTNSSLSAQIPLCLSGCSYKGSGPSSGKSGGSY